MRRAAIAIGCVLLVACALAQEGKHQAGKATPAPAAPTKVGTVGAKSGQAAPRKMGRRPAGEPPATPLVGWIEDRFDQIHILAKVGAPGAFLAGVIGLYSFFRKPPEIKRQKIRWVHVITAIVFGLIAATHAVAFDTHHKIGGEADELWRSGTWLAAALIFLLITGAFRFWSWHHHVWWRRTHRTFQVLFLVALCVHVIPKILHAHTY